MREFKFRAWNGECLCERVYIEQDFKSTKIKAGANQYSGLQSPKDLVLMQYTGLKDVNGKEIFEGDIVHLPYNYLGNVVVKFMKGKFSITNFDLNEKIKIVGNIYETPELMKTKGSDLI